jgi:hypothetical protein
MGESTYVVVEGVVEKLEIFNVHVQFLASARKKQRNAGIVATIQAAAGEPGAVHSAQAATDSGDPVDGFKMMLGSQLVSGSFWQTTFKNGDRVQAIGEMQGSVFHAVAVVKPAEGIIWMQPHCERGTLAKSRRLATYSLGFAAAIFLVQAFLLRNFAMPLWLFLLASTLGVTVILVTTVGLSWKDFMGFAKEVDKVGKALAIPSPEKIDLAKSTKNSRRQGKPELPMGVFYL